jgi:hypothetical protein
MLVAEPLHVVDEDIDSFATAHFEVWKALTEQLGTDAGLGDI